MVVKEASEEIGKSTKNVTELENWQRSKKFTKLCTDIVIIRWLGREWR